MTTEPTLNLQKIQTLLHSSHMDEPIKALKELEAFPLKGEVLETYIHILDHALWKVRKLAARRLEQEIGITFPHVAKCILDETADRRHRTICLIPAATYC